VTRTLKPGQPYTDVAPWLDQLGAQGWELVSAQVVQRMLENEWVEIFYLKQVGTVAEEVPPAK
jgi:hypothetical protein